MTRRPSPICYPRHPNRTAGLGRSIYDTIKERERERERERREKISVIADTKRLVLSFSFYSLSSEVDWKATDGIGVLVNASQCAFEDQMGTKRRGSAGCLG